MSTIVPKPNTKEEKKTLFFFIAKKVKRNTLYESRAILQKNNIKLVKITSFNEKKIRKIRPLSHVLKSAVLLGTTEKKFDLAALKQFSQNEIPGIDFIGVFSNNCFFSKNRLFEDNYEKKQLFHNVFNKTITAPQKISNLLLQTTSILTSIK